MNRLANLYVSDTGSNTILEFDASGHESVFATWGLNQPEGLAFDSSGNLYVASYGNDTIVKFDPSGNGSVFANTGFDRPTFIAIQVPEPSTWSLLALGAVTLFGGLRLRRRAL